MIHSRYIRLIGFSLCAALVLLGAPTTTRATNGSAATSLASGSARIFIHGHVPAGTVSDGNHNFRVRVFAKDGGLVHEEQMVTEVRANAYDLLLGSTKPLLIKLVEQMPIRVSIDGGQEMATDGRAASLSANSEYAMGQSLAEIEQNGFAAIVKDQLAAQSAERIARHRASLGARMHDVIAMMVPYAPASGLELEMGVAPPATNIPNDPYQLAKYGRINIEYKNLAMIDGNRFGLAAQAMHVAHHLLLYSAGISTDVNNDGMFTFTTGITHYQVGQKRNEPFVDAPFMRFKFRSSPDQVFAYSELETTMHDRAYISGMLGLGMMVAPGVRFVAGFAHTEFVMPTEQIVQQINGVQGTFMWGAR